MEERGSVQAQACSPACVIGCCSISNDGLDDGDIRVECLRVRIRAQANKANTMVTVCCRPLSRDEEAEEMFYKQLGSLTLASPCSCAGFEFTREVS